MELAGSRAGAARVELPWIKDIILAGWGPFQSMGVRYAKTCDSVPLCARALVLEDPQRQRVALVALDLHGGSRYISERAARALHDEGFHPGNLFLSATHNHSGPGGLYGSQYYDAFCASTEFLKKSSKNRLALNITLADFITGKVVEAVRLAVARLTRAQVGQSSAPGGWATNRSIKAFRNNFPRNTGDDELQKILGEALGSTPGKPEAMAVDSRVHTIAAFEEEAPHRLIGSFSTFGAHCALLSREHMRQSPDFFGQATDAAERELAADQGTRPVIALAAGAIGDADPLQPGTSFEDLLERRWDFEENEVLIQEHAVQLTTVLRKSIDGTRTKCHPIERITTAFSEAQIADATLKNGKKLGEFPRIGTSTIAGAELGTGDGRVWILRFKFSELVGVDRREGFEGDPQFPKRMHGPIFPPYATAFKATRGPLATQYNRLGLRLVQVQCRDLAEPIRLLGVPGEPTTWLTHKLNQILKGGAADRPTMVAGVTGDYHGYFATSLEYDMQHYEGSSTIWGRETEGWLREKVEDLVAQVEDLAAGRSQPVFPTGEVTFATSLEDEWRTEIPAEPVDVPAGTRRPDGIWHLS